MPRSTFIITYTKGAIIVKSIIHNQTIEKISVIHDESIDDESSEEVSTIKVSDGVYGDLSTEWKAYLCKEKWTARDVISNIVSLAVTLAIGTYWTIQYNPLYVIIYFGLFALYLFVGRYFTCRHCSNYGVKCAHYALGWVTSKIYKKSKKPELKKSRIHMLDHVFFNFSIIFPYILFFRMYSVGSIWLWWVLLAYTVAVVILNTFSNKACSKCYLDCPLAKMTHKKADVINSHKLELSCHENISN